MRIHNKENIITNKQIEKCLQRYNKNIISRDVKIIINQSAKDIFNLKFLSFVHKLVYYFSNINCEGSYNSYHNIIIINLNNIEGNVSDKKLYAIGVIIHEIQHMIGNNKESECDNIAMTFLNRNSKYLSEVLNLENEYIMEEF